MIKSIMVAMDGSPASKAALKVAAKWAARLDAELRGVFVEDEQRFITYPAGLSAEGGIPISAPLPEADMEKENARVRAEGEEIRTALERVVGDNSLTFQFTQVRGDVNALLTRHARAADLCVMGRRGRTQPGFGNEPGPTTETLIHNALRPCLVVPENSREGEGIVFAFDGGKGVQRLLPAATYLALKSEAPISVISVGKDPSFNTDQEEILRRYWEPYGIEANCRVVAREGRVADTIVAFADSEGVETIVMGAFGHNPIHELFFGSTTLDTMGRANCPVLLMA